MTRLIHRHKWVVVEKKEQPSAFEQMHAGGEMDEFKGGRPWVFERRVIVHYRCEKCGGERVVLL